MSNEPVTGFGALALDAARSGVAAIAAVLAGGALRTEYKSAAHDLVTAADKAAEAAVIAVIRAARPADAILGEETGAQAGTTGVRWLVDPLDGTANFVYGRGDHAVSVGVESDGQIIAGAVIRPADGRWAMADRTELRTGRQFPGGVITVDEPPPSIDARTTAAGALVAFGLPYSLTARAQVLGLISGIVPSVRGVRIMGSAAADLLAVACGNVDAFVGFDLAEWDTAAGCALVIAAGGGTARVTVGGLSALIAGPPTLVHELVAVLRDTAGDPATDPRI